MDRRQFLTGTAAVLTPAIAGCGGDSGDGNGNGDGGNGGSGNGNGASGNGDEQTTDPNGGDGTTTDGEGVSSAVTVDMEDTAFDPVSVEIAVGETVEWVNKDGFGHDVTSAQFSDGAASWDYAESLDSDGSATYTFENAGVYEYYCTIHGKSNMCGVVIVGDTTYQGSLPCKSSSEDDGGGDDPYY